jgi:hypothetical protein
MLLVVEGRFLIRRDCADSNKTQRRWVYVLEGQEASMAATSVKFDDASSRGRALQDDLHSGRRS